MIEQLTKVKDSYNVGAPAIAGATAAFDDQEWLAENRAGRPNFERLRQADRDHEIERVGAVLRADGGALPALWVERGARGDAGRQRCHGRGLSGRVGPGRPRRP